MAALDDMHLGRLLGPAPLAVRMRFLLDMFEPMYAATSIVGAFLMLGWRAKLLKTRFEARCPLSIFTLEVAIGRPPKMTT